MATLPSPLMSRCRTTLLRFDKFDSAEKLKTVFVVEELKPYHDALPEANSPEDRVDKTIAFLLGKGSQQGSFVFLAFLRTLQNIYVSKEEALYIDLNQLCIEVESEHYLFEIKRARKQYDTSSAMAGSMFDQPEKLIELVKCLLKCRHMSNGNQRERVLSQLPKGITHKLVRSDRDSDFADALHIVQACSGYTDGVEQLADRLFQFEGDSSEWRALDRLLRQIFLKSVTYSRLQQLQPILTKMTWPDTILRKAYTATIPGGWKPLNISYMSDTLLLMLEDLAKIIPQNDGRVPILEFVEHLAHYAQRQQELFVQDNLRDWVDERANELGLSVAQVAVVRHKVMNCSGPLASYLLVTLDAIGENIFDVEAWLLDAEYEPIEEASIKVNERSMTLESIPRLLETVLEQCVDYLAKDFIVEFSLPNELLCCPADHWLINTGSIQVKLGIEYKVVVRSFKRAREHKRFRRSWIEKWNTLQEFMNGKQQSTGYENLIWICTEEQCGKDRFYAFLHGSSVVCLGLTFEPSSLHTTHIFDTTLSAGIPIALWPRELTNHPKTIDNLFTSLLSHQTLNKLPLLVWKQRIDADVSSDEQHQGHHLTLLWDDPNRLPPSIAKQFAMPSVRRGAQS